MSSESRDRLRKGKKKRTSNNVRVTLVLITAALLVAVGLVVADRNGSSDGSNASGSLVRPDSQRLSTGSTPTTFVEFLDFECESCKAAFPAIEELRGIYGDRVTFVVRYMPLHANSVHAARAAEAAAAQGRFEDMYKKLFDTQLEWGEKRTSQQAVFFRYATEMGFDMRKFQDSYNDSNVIAKINRDEKDGRAAGVEGTPTFFLDGKKMTATSIDDFKAQFDRALAS